MTAEELGLLVLYSLLLCGAQALEGYGLLKLHPIAWWVAIIVNTIGFVSGLGAVIGGFTAAASLWATPAALVSLYLWMPHVRRAFLQSGRGRWGKVPIPRVLPSV